MSASSLKTSTDTNFTAGRSSNKVSKIGNPNNMRTISGGRSEQSVRPPFPRVNNLGSFSMQQNLIVRPQNLQELRAIHSEAHPTAVFYVSTILVLYFFGLIVIVVHYMNSSYGKWNWNFSDVFDEFRPSKGPSRERDQQRSSCDQYVVTSSSSHTSHSKSYQNKVSSANKCRESIEEEVVEAELVPITMEKKTTSKNTTTTKDIIIKPNQCGSNKNLGFYLRKSREKVEESNFEFDEEESSTQLIRRTSFTKSSNNVWVEGLKKLRLSPRNSKDKLSDGKEINSILGVEEEEEMGEKFTKEEEESCLEKNQLNNLEIRERNPKNVITIEKEPQLTTLTGNILA